MPRLFKFLLIAIALCLFGQVEASAQRYGRPQVELDPNTLKQQAFESYMSGEFESSADLYKKALELGKNKYGDSSSFVADLYYELGTMSLEEGNFKRASIYLPLAVKAKPNSVMARVKMSELYMMQGRLDDAFSQVQQAQMRNPGSIEAQKQLVKLMMERAKKNSDCSEAANLACTMESFKLSDFSRQLVRNTNKIIAQWKERIKNGDEFIPVVSVAMTAPKIIPSPPQPKPAMIKPPPPKSTPKPEPRKSKPKKITPKPPPQKKVVKPKPKPKPAVQQTRVVTTSKPQKRNGLVPPPPPMPIYTQTPPPQTANTTIKLDAKAEVKKKKPKKKPVKKKQVIPDEPDFILDWASKKKK